MNDPIQGSLDVLPADRLKLLYTRHVQGAIVRSGASVIMWLFAMTAYVGDIIKTNHFTGITLSVLYLISINPPTLFLLKRLHQVRTYRYCSLLINFLEILGYTAIIYFVGGIEATYLIPVYAALITYVGVAAPWRFPYAIACSSSIAFSLMVAGVHYGFLQDQKVVPSFHVPWPNQVVYVSVSIGLLFVVAYIASLTANILKRNRDLLRRQNLDLMEKSSSLEAAERELRTAHRELERRVDERTLQLKEANDHLSNVVADLERMRLELQKSRDELERRVRDRTAALTETNQRLEREIDERRRIETELLNSESKYRLLADNVNDIILTMDFSMRQTYCSPSVERMRGFTVEEAIAQSLDEILAPSSYELAVRTLVQQISTFRGTDDDLSKTWSLDLELICKDGSTIWTEMNIRPVVVSPNGDIELLGVARDITQRKQDEERLMRSLSEKEVLLREVHHRVKNNLQLTASMLALQAEAVRDDAVTQALKDAQTRVWAMASAHETLYRSANVAEISSRNYFSEILGLICVIGQSGSGRITLTEDLDDIPMNIDMAINCGLILSELLANCHKHAFSDTNEGAIVVSFKVAGENRLELAVQDNGIGMPMALDPRNLKSFGLKLVTILVEELGGEMQVKRDGGTEVRITFAM